MVKPRIVAGLDVCRFNSTNTLTIWLIVSIVIADHLALVDRSTVVEGAVCPEISPRLLAAVQNPPLQMHVAANSMA